MNKNILRQQMKQVRAAITDREIQSKQICEWILKSRAYTECELLLVYLAIQSEVSLETLIQQALQDEKQVAIPRILGPHCMEFRLYDEDLLERGAFHTWQPTQQAALITIDTQKVLMIAPGLAFTKDGKRLGYGGGYYDAYLKGKTMMIYGAAYNEQIIPSIEIEEHDRCMDGIITPGGFYDCIRTGNIETN